MVGLWAELAGQTGGLQAILVDHLADLVDLLAALKVGQEGRSEEREVPQVDQWVVLVGQKVEMVKGLMIPPVLLWGE